MAMLTPAQLRAARALLGIDQRTLAERAGVSLPTIQRMEATSDGYVRGVVDTLTKVVDALEREGIELIRKNAEKFGCRNIHTIAGTAPEAMEGLPKMDVIIIGGSSGNMHEILDRCEALLAPGGRIILTAVTVETTGEVVKEFADRPFELEGFEMQINRLRKLGRYHLYDPMSPIFIFTAIKH